MINIFYESFGGSRYNEELSGAILIIWNTLESFELSNVNNYQKLRKIDPKITQKWNLSRASCPCKVYSWSSPSGESKIIVIPGEEKYGEPKRTWNFWDISKKHLQNHTFVFLLKLDAGGKPSTRFPPEWLVELTSVTARKSSTVTEVD